MRLDVEIRILEEARWIIKNAATVRQTAKEFHVSKSTVHLDLTEKLQRIDPYLYREVQKHLAFNLGQRHIRGGESTKYLFERRKGLII